MPRAYRHLTWRAFKRATDHSGLQTLQRVSRFGNVPSQLEWVTVARGPTVYIEKIAEALNRARFTLFDIRLVRETPMKLTKFEQRILDVLQARVGEIVSKPELEKEIYPDEPNIGPQSNRLEVFVNRIRKKIGRERIQTTRGRGYMLVSAPPVATDQG